MDVHVDEFESTKLNNGWFSFANGFGRTKFKMNREVEQPRENRLQKDQIIDALKRCSVLGNGIYKFISET